MSTDQSRIARRFAALSQQGRAAFIPFITAGDPDPETSQALLDRLPAAGADLIELGIPFTDPMADGPAIQAASLRALKAHASLAGTLEMVRRFRAKDTETPVLLMGYFNPIHAYGTGRFVADARTVGVDGLIVVDVPPEEDSALGAPARAAGLDVIRLATPTTSEARLPAVLAGASGFLYYVSVTGVTGAATAAEEALQDALKRLRNHTDLPISVGFGIKSPEQAAAVARIADGVVVGSAIVERIAQALDAQGRAPDGLADTVARFVGELAGAAHSVVKQAPSQG